SARREAPGSRPRRGPSAPPRRGLPPPLLRRQRGRGPALPAAPARRRNRRRAGPRGGARRGSSLRSGGRRLGEAGEVEQEGPLAGALAVALVAAGRAAVAGLHVRVEVEPVRVRLHLA